MRTLTLTALLFLGSLTFSTAQQPSTTPAEAKDAKAVELVLEDQFERRQDLAAHRGNVVVLVYGDRRASDACRKFGEKMHILFHPTAEGQAPEKARSAPVADLEGVPMGKRSPDALFIPVASTGTVPGLVKDVIRAQIKKGSPDVPVWLDFNGLMEKNFGLRGGEPNLVVFDGQGRLRMKINGTPDAKAQEKLLQTIQNLRAEAAGIAK
ncbi:MAG: TlpA family protein disulfide reductase [Fimbriiglobus sp.]